MDWYVMDDFNPYSIRRTFIRIGEQKLGDFQKSFPKYSPTIHGKLAKNTI